MSGVAGNKSKKNNKLSLVNFLVGVSGHQAYYAAGNFHCRCVKRPFESSWLAESPLLHVLVSYMKRTPLHRTEDLNKIKHRLRIKKTNSEVDVLLESSVCCFITF